VEINCEDELYWGTPTGEVTNCRVSEQSVSSLAVNILLY